MRPVHHDHGISLRRSRLLLLITLAACGTSSADPRLEDNPRMPSDPEELADRLLGVWIHSHEEDDGDLMVLRRAGYDFPPSRGRSGFTLLEDGSVQVYRPGPVDRGETSDGNWSLAGDTLTVMAPGWSGAFEIEAVEENVLKVRRHGKAESDG